MFRRALLTAALVAAASPALADNLPDGRYHCDLDGILFGDFIIEGNTYRGPATGTQFGRAYTYELFGDDQITWNGPLGAMDSNGNQVLSSEYYDIEDGTTGFQILMRPSGSTNGLWIDCNPD